jgi:hypothetical protein
MNVWGTLNVPKAIIGTYAQEPSPGSGKLLRVVVSFLHWRRASAKRTPDPASGTRERAYLLLFSDGVQRTTADAYCLDPELGDELFIC